MALPGFLKPRELTRIGVIRLGARVANSSGRGDHPSELPHFRLDDAPGVAEVFGPNPTSITVRIPCLDHEKFFPTRLERWGSKDRLCSSKDGATAWERDPQTGQYIQIPCAYRDCPYWQKKDCDEIGRLKVVIPAVRIDGYYELRTTSRLGISNVVGEFASVQQLLYNATGSEEAVLAVDFQLTREEEQTPYMAGGQKKSSRHYIVHLRAPVITQSDANRYAAQFRSGHASLALADDEDERPDAETEAAGEDGSAGADPVAWGGAEIADEDDGRPDDLVKGGTPRGPDLGQKTAWAKLIEVAQGLGKPATVIESSVCGMVAKGIARFDDLTGEEATQAIAKLADMLKSWQAEAGGNGSTNGAKRGNGKPKPAPAPEPAAQSAPEPAPQLTMDDAGDDDVVIGGI